MYRIFHFNDEKVREAGRCGYSGEAQWPEEYTLVADVECESVDQAFGLTNHIDRPWWEDSRVTRHGPPTRSTSVGDVVAYRDGQRLLARKCERAGWGEPFEVSDQDLLLTVRLR